LGNGRQRKSYLYVQDCIDAVLLATARPDEAYTVYNLGIDDSCVLDDSIGWICERLGVSPQRIYSGGDRGWIGDNPTIMLETTKIRALGWSPSLTIRQAVERTVDYLNRETWVLERRS
jgi:UDP-glucose 4-epimerase